MIDEIKLLAKERPLSDRTALERRNLVVASAAGLALNAGSVGELLGFSKPSGDPSLAKGAFCVAIGYLLVMFIVGVLKDRMLWKSAKTVIDLRWASGDFHEMFAAVWEAQEQSGQKMPEHLVRPLGNLHSFLMGVGEAKLAADAATRRLAVFEFWRLYILDIGLPIALGAIAFWRLVEFVPPFLRTAFS